MGTWGQTNRKQRACNVQILICVGGSCVYFLCDLLWWRKLLRSTWRRAYLSGCCIIWVTFFNVKPLSHLLLQQHKKTRQRRQQLSTACHTARMHSLSTVRHNHTRCDCVATFPSLQRASHQITLFLNFFCRLTVTLSLMTVNNRNPYPNLKPRLPEKTDDLCCGNSFCTPEEGGYPQCDCVYRFMSCSDPQHPPPTPASTVATTCTHTHTSAITDAPSGSLFLGLSLCGMLCWLGNAS